jgi:hypothetical protein
MSALLSAKRTEMPPVDQRVMQDLACGRAIEIDAIVGTERDQVGLNYPAILLGDTALFSTILFAGSTVSQRESPEK